MLVRMLIFMGLIVLTRPLLLAQNLLQDSIQEESTTDLFLEQLMEQNLNAEEDSEIDPGPSFLPEGLLQKGLDINKASQDELLLLPGISLMDAQSIIAYRKFQGQFTSLYELQAVQGLSLEQLRQIRPFMRIGPMGTSGSGINISSPSLNTLFKGLEGESILRYSNKTESQSSLPGSSLGSPYQLFGRLKIRYPGHLSINLTGEKDRGEALQWQPPERQYGLDFYSGHIALKNMGPWKYIILGDYHHQFGQGLILGGGFGLGKGSQTVSGVKSRGPEGIAYGSVNEIKYFRGATACYAAKAWEFSLFASSRNRDASIQKGNSWGAETDTFIHLQSSGMHRTPSELQARGAIQERLWGGRIAYKKTHLSIGFSHLHQYFSQAINPQPQSYNQQSFRGKTHHLYSLDWDWVHGNVNAFGEVARSQSGGWAMVAGLMTSLHPKIGLSLVLRNYSPGFQSMYGRGFAEAPTRMQNERGLYLGIHLKVNSQWSIHAFLDQFHFPLPKYQVDLPSKGYDYLIQASYRPARHTQVYLRLQGACKEKNPSASIDTQGLALLIPQYTTSLRLHFETRLSSRLTLRTRLNFSKASGGKKGILLYQDIIWKWGFRTKLMARYAQFDISDYDTRIYAYENDVLGQFSIPAYYGKGNRYYVIFQCSPLPFLDCWIRYASSLKQGKLNQGRVSQDFQREWKVQIRLRF